MAVGSVTSWLFMNFAVLNYLAGICSLVDAGFSTEVTTEIGEATFETLYTAYVGGLAIIDTFRGLIVLSANTC
jgi:hypothetical protein